MDPYVRITSLKGTCRFQAKVIRVQWIVILVLIVALVAALISVNSVSASSYKHKAELKNASEAIIDEPEMLSAPVIEPTPEPTPAPTPEPTPTLASLGEYKLTAYCPCKKCCGKSENDPAYGITASGARATANHTIAVDPKVIPFGTEVVINGHTYVAEDVGGAIKGNRIDIFFDSHEEALTFGVQYATVYVSNNN